MKTITVEIDDKVFSEMKACLAVKGLCGTAGGIHDEFIHRLIKAVEEGQETLTLRWKGTSQ